MSKKYTFVMLEKANKINNEQFTVAYILDKETNKPKLIIDVIIGLVNKSKQTCIFVGEREADKYPGEFYGLVYLDAELFISLKKSDPKHFKVMMFHELGHYILGHLNNDNVDFYQKNRTNLDDIHPFEIAADKFAIQECGLLSFLSFMDFMIERRKSFENDKNKEKAIVEFEKRKISARSVK